MAKEAGVVVEGNIIKAYPNALFDIKLDNDTIIRGHISGKLRKHYIKIILGDIVEVELSIYDITKGRIIKRK
jgi:translation initiation factor IF-1